MSVSLALQIAIRTRLIQTAAVTTLVPAASILDRNQRPAPSPSIILGEAQAVDENSDTARRRTRVYHTIHVFNREPGLEGVQEIAGNVREAIHWQRVQLTAPFHCVDTRVSGIRLMRDPDGETAHAVVTVEALIHEVVT